MPLLMRMIMRPMQMLAISEETCGEWMLFAMLDPEAKTGAWFRRDHGQKVQASKYADEKAREAIWRDVEQKTNV